MSSSLTTLVGENLGEEGYKWSDSVYCNANKHVYGIPANARRVLKFNPIDKSSALIGPDLGDEDNKYRGGTEDEKGCIYCTPYHWNSMLKIDTNTDTVTILTARPPELRVIWTKGVLGLDGNIYFIPWNAHHILKLNTNTDTFESVGDDLGKTRMKYAGAVRGIDGCIYGIPDRSIRGILKYDPVSQVTSYVGKTHDQYFKCVYNGALARDGCIYALSGHGEVLKINTNNDDNDNDTFSWALIGKRGDEIDYRWGNAIAGIDGCVYWPPLNANHTLQHDPHIDHTSLVGNDFRDEECKWVEGALASDGVIYCMPLNASHVLAIDPFREFTETLTSDMRQFPPEEFGRLFELVGERGMTKFDYAIAKFGQRGFQTIANLLPPANEALSNNQRLYPFMVAASLPNSALSLVYHLILQAPELMRRR